MILIKAAEDIGKRVEKYETAKNYPQKEGFLQVINDTSNGSNFLMYLFEDEVFDMKGCNYLSGGQDLPTAAARLSAINKANRKGPWNLSFSWSQALQLPLLDLFC